MADIPLLVEQVTVSHADVTLGVTMRLQCHAWVSHQVSRWCHNEVTTPRMGVTPGVIMRR